MRRLLDPTRALWDQRRPRSWRERRRYKPRQPSWVHGDLLQRQLDARDSLLQQGEVVWGHLVQANSQLWEPGKQDHPASLVYSPDPAYDDCLPALGELAHELYLLKGTQPADPAAKQLAATLTDEVSRPARDAGPPTYSHEKEAYLTTLLVHRDHLPGGVLRAGFVPLLIAPQLTPWTLILPGEFWSPELQAAWRDA